MALLGVHFRWVRLIGMVLDIIGAVIIATAVIRMHNINLKKLSSIDALEEELGRMFRSESNRTLLGLGFLIAGFLVLFITELVQTIRFTPKLN